MQEGNFLRFFVVTLFSLGMIIIGTQELHKMYVKGEIGNQYRGKRHSPRRYIEIFYGAGQIEKAAFGKRMKDASKLTQREHLDDGDRRDIKRIIKKIFR